MKVWIQRDCPHCHGNGTIYCPDTSRIDKCQDCEGKGHVTEFISIDRIRDAIHIIDALEGDQISLRDYLAGKALAAIGEFGIRQRDALARWCYEVADAMLEVRKSPNQKDK